jgi:hypothetical protein
MSNIFKQFQNEVYQKLKQKSTSFITLREIKICDFTVSEYCAIHEEIKSEKLIVCIFTIENGLSIVDDIDIDDPSAFLKNDLIFEIPNNDFSRFTLGYLKYHSHKSHSDILNFLIPYTDYYDYSKFAMLSEIGNYLICDNDKFEYLTYIKEIFNYESNQKSAWSLLDKHYSIDFYIREAKDMISYIRCTRSKEEKEDQKKRVMRTINLCLAKTKILNMSDQIIDGIPKKDIIKHIDNKLELICKQDN